MQREQLSQYTTSQPRSRKETEHACAQCLVQVTSEARQGAATLTLALTRELAWWRHMTQTLDLIATISFLAPYFGSHSCRLCGIRYRLLARLRGNQWGKLESTTHE